jgi:hypothetical protein
VRYEVLGPLPDVTACHCGQCRRQSGHFYATTSVAAERFTLTEDRGLKWYSASATARRGFSGECGSIVLWQPITKDRVAILAGSLDAPTGLKLARHIFVADKGDYYEIDDGLPQHAAYDDAPA